MIKQITLVESLIWTMVLECSLVQFVDSSWGRHTVDHFASFYNAQMPRFIVEAFTQDWSRDNNWLCPPVSLIVRAVRHLITCEGLGSLIIPKWPSSYFWPCC